MITKIPGNEAKDKEQTDQRTRTFLHWCVYVSKYIYIYNLVLVRSIEMIHQCMGSRGARGRTGVFDGLTLIIKKMSKSTDRRMKMPCQTSSEREQSEGGGGTNS